MLVLAAGSQPNFFNTPGAAENAFPLYSLDDATRLRSRILGLFEQVDRDPTLVERGALNFVVVGGGPTGVEVAGAIADMVDGDRARRVPQHRRRQRRGSTCSTTATRCSKPFSDKAHEYVAKVLQATRASSCTWAPASRRSGTGHALLSDGTVIPTRCVIWGGGIKAAPVAADAASPRAAAGASTSSPT